MQQALDWASAHLERTHTLDSLAKRAHMSRRSFTRRFRSLTGTSVGPWLVAQRVSLAQRLLETSDASVDQIADRMGFGSALSLRQHFATQLRTSPSQYRRAFRA